MSKTWAAIATLPVLFDGYIIEDEHLVMAETVFTFLLMVAVCLLLWRPGLPRWWVAVIAGLLVGYAVIVRTEGVVMLAVLPLCLLLRGWAWKTLRAWLVAIAFTVASLVPLGAYMNWFHERTGHYGTTMSAGYYLWGRMSSFADCARINPSGEQAVVCPRQPIKDRTPPGNYIWHAPYVHADMRQYLHGHHEERQGPQELRPGQPRGQQGADGLRDPRGRGAAARLREDGVL